MMRLRSESGAVAVEFVFVVPVLIMIFLATVQFGLAVYRTQMAEAAAREGARVASVGVDAEEVRNHVIDSAPGFTVQELTEDGEIEIATRPTVSDPWTLTESGCQARGHDVKVTVTAAGPRFEFDIPLVDSFTPTYSAEAVFRCEAS